MATLLDVGLLQHFEIIFPFLLVFVMSLVALSYLAAFRDNKAMQATVAMALAFMTLLSDVAVKTILRMAPWFVVLFITGTFVVLVYMTIGFKPEDIHATLTGDSYKRMFGYFIFAVTMIVFVGSLSSVISEEQGFLSLTNATAVGGDEAAGFFQVLVNPKVLGMVLILMVAVVTILKLTEG